MRPWIPLIVAIIAFAVFWPIGYFHGRYLRRKEAELERETANGQRREKGAGK